MTTATALPPIGLQPVCPVPGASTATPETGDGFARLLDEATPVRVEPEASSTLPTAHASGRVARGRDEPIAAEASTADNAALPAQGGARLQHRPQVRPAGANTPGRLERGVGFAAGTNKLEGGQEGAAEDLASLLDARTEKNPLSPNEAAASNRPWLYPALPAQPPIEPAPAADALGLLATWSAAAANAGAEPHAGVHTVNGDDPGPGREGGAQVVMTPSRAGAGAGAASIRSEFSDRAAATATPEAPGRAAAPASGILIERSLPAQSPRRPDGPDSTTPPANATAAVRAAGSDATAATTAQAERAQETNAAVTAAAPGSATPLQGAAAQALLDATGQGRREITASTATNNSLGRTADGRTSAASTVSTAGATPRDGHDERCAIVASGNELPTPTAPPAAVNLPPSASRSSVDTALRTTSDSRQDIGSGVLAGSTAPMSAALAFVAPGYGAPIAASTTTEGRIAARPGSAEFAPQLAAHITTFVRDGVQTARLELSPGEMGPLTVQIQLDGNAARVHLAAENAQTRQALEQAMPQLAGSLREGGLTLSGGGVFEQPRQPQQQAQAQAGGDGPGHGQARNGAEGPGNPGTAAGREATSLAVPVARRRVGTVDLVA